MSPRLRKLVLVLMMLWLPWQSAWAAIGPLCTHQAAGVAENVTQSAGHVHSAHHDHTQQPAQSSPSFDDSGQCHHSSMFAIPGFTAGFTLDAGTAYTESASAHFFQFIPEQPQRPPLA